MDSGSRLSIVRLSTLALELEIGLAACTTSNNLLFLLLGQGNSAARCTRTPHSAPSPWVAGATARCCSHVAPKNKERSFTHGLFLSFTLHFMVGIFFRLLACPVPPLDHKPTRRNGSLYRSHVAPKSKSF